MRDRSDCHPIPNRREVRLHLADCATLHNVALVGDSTGKRLRIDDQEYDLGGWLNLPLSQAEVEAIFRALPRAERELAR